MTIKTFHHLPYPPHLHFSYFIQIHCNCSCFSIFKTFGYFVLHLRHPGLRSFQSALIESSLSFYRPMANTFGIFDRLISDMLHIVHRLQISYKAIRSNNMFSSQG